MDVAEFKQKLAAAEDLAKFAGEVLLGGEAKYVTAEQVAIISEAVAKRYGVAKTEVVVLIVGSAKLGFSISNKYEQGVVTKPRYRKYHRNESDIDVAVISEKIFVSIWKEISAYAYRHEGFPHFFKKIGSYMTGGWMRPDLFPSRGLQKCDNWWDVFRTLSLDRRLGMRRVRGALYFSHDQLNQYQQRALRECLRDDGGGI